MNMTFERKKLDRLLIFFVNLLKLLNSFYSCGKVFTLKLSDLQQRGDHGLGKKWKTVLTFSRQGKHREFCCNTGKVFETQGEYF